MNAVVDDAHPETTQMPVQPATSAPGARTGSKPNRLSRLPGRLNQAPAAASNGPDLFDVEASQAPAARLEQVQRAAVAHGRIPGEEHLYDVEAYDGFSADSSQQTPSESTPQTRPHDVVPTAGASAQEAGRGATADQAPIPTHMHSAGAHKSASQGASQQAARPAGGLSRSPSLQNNTQTATTEQARGEQVVQSSRGAYVLPSEEMLVSGPPAKEYSEVNEHVVEALTSVLEQFKVDAHVTGF